VVLLGGDALVLEEISKYALEIYDYHRVLQLVRATTEVVTVGTLEKAVGLRVELRFDVFLLLDLGLLVRYGLLREGLPLLVRKLVLPTFSQLGHAVLVRVACLVLDAHLRPLAVLGHSLRVFVALIAQLKDPSLLGGAEAGGLSAVDHTRYELVSFS
jgi:hypothetical protein